MSDSKLEPNADGAYQIITNRSNQFFVQFDLKQYDGKLTNGDYFDVDYSYTGNRLQWKD